MESTGLLSYRTRGGVRKRRRGSRSFRGFTSRVIAITKSAVRRNSELKIYTQSFGPISVIPNRPLFHELTPRFSQGSGKDEVIGSRIKYNFLTVVCNIQFRLSNHRSIAHLTNYALMSGYYKVALVFSRTDMEVFMDKGDNRIWMNEKRMHQAATIPSGNVFYNPALDQFNPSVVAVKAFDEGVYTLRSDGDSLAQKTLRWSIPLNMDISMPTIDEGFGERDRVPPKGRYYLAIGTQNQVERDYVELIVSVSTKLSFYDS